MAEMARSVKRIRPTDIHDSPDTFRKIRSFPYWLIAMRQYGEKVCHVRSEPFVLWGHIHRVFAAFFLVCCARMVMLHDRQRWSKSRTTKGLLLALTLSH
jgi:hypothetical protein